MFQHVVRKTGRAAARAIRAKPATAALRGCRGRMRRRRSRRRRTGRSFSRRVVARTAGAAAERRPSRGRIRVTRGVLHGGRAPARNPQPAASARPDPAVPARRPCTAAPLAAPRMRRRGGAGPPHLPSMALAFSRSGLRAAPMSFSSPRIAKPAHADAVISSATRGGPMRARNGFFE